jgi:hypothetical protein
MKTKATTPEEAPAAAPEAQFQCRLAGSVQTEAGKFAAGFEGPFNESVINANPDKFIKLRQLR